MLDFPLPGLIRISIRTCSYLLRFVRHVSAKTWCGIVFTFPNGTRSTYHWFFRGNGWLSHWMSDWVFPIATLSLITNPMPPLRKQHIKQPKSDPEMNGSTFKQGKLLGGDWNIVHVSSLFHILGMSSSQLINIFQSWNHQPGRYCSPYWVRIGMTPPVAAQV